MTPGIYEYIDADTYHQDFTGDPRQNGQPTLSASTAHTLLTRSPAHARHNHPRLNPDYKREDEQRFDVGKVAHQVLLEGAGAVSVVPAADWRTSQAREAREWARDNKLTPLLEKDWERVQEMVTTIRVQVAELDVEPVPFTAGRPEVTLVWHEPNGVACRARVDWLHDRNEHISDLKTTRASANPEAWCRSTLWSIGADIQVAAYTRAVEALTGVRPELRYVVVECEPPYALSVVSLSPAALALGVAKWERAVQLWGECLASGEWPGYPSAVAYAEVPGWLEAQWLEREAREEIAA